MNTFHYVQSNSQRPYCTPATKVSHSPELAGPVPTPVFPATTAQSVTAASSASSSSYGPLWLPMPHPAAALAQEHITKARRALSPGGDAACPEDRTRKGAHEAEGAAWTRGPLEGPRLLWVNEGKLLGRRLKGQIEARS